MDKHEGLSIHRAVFQLALWPRHVLTA